MLIGNPDKFAFLIEKVSDWSSCGFTNGLMYIFINGKSYPEDVYTTTLNTELNILTEDNSAFMNPVVNNELFSTESQKLFDYFCRTTFDNGDLRYQLPWQQLGDAGCFVFAVATEDKVKIQIGRQISADRINFTDETVILSSEYKKIVSQLENFKEQL